MLICADNSGATVRWGSSSNNFSSQDIVCYPNANRYELQYRLIGATTWVNSATLTALSQYSFTGLSGNMAYEWRIRHSFNDGSTGTYSAPASFTTTGCVPPPSPFVGNYNFHDCSTPTVVWIGCSGTGTRYELRYRAIGSLPWTSTVAAEQPPNLYSQLSCPIRDLPDYIPYEVQVRSICASGDASEYSASVTVAAGCGQPYECVRTKSICHYNVTATTAILSWQGSGPFELRWRKGYTTTWNIVQIPHYGRENAATFLLTNLEPNTPYDWQVRSLCTPNGGFSSVDFFRTVCNAPITGRANTIRPTSAKLTWAAADASLMYKLFWRKADETNWQIITAIATPFYSLTGLTRSTAYEWRIETDCGASLTAVSGPVRIFRTTATATAVSTSIATIRNGNWNDPGTWACNRIPTNADAVTIGHIVTVPTGATGNALKIVYGVGGKVLVSTGGRVSLEP